MNLVETKPKNIKIKINSEISRINEVIEKISNISNRLDKEADYFVIYELIANAIEHGNKFDEHKEVTIEVFNNEEFFRVVIADQGDGFDWKKYLCAELDLEGFSDRGRGIIMTKMMCDYLFYNKKGNEVTVLNLKR